MKVRLLVVGAVLTQVVGCASIVTGHNQSLSVETRDAAGPVVGASCKLENDKGTWFVTTPGSTTVRRSLADMAIRCDKDGSMPGITSTKSSTKGMVAGNILFGGLIGAGVDVATGAAFDYPSLITVEMGKTAAPSSDAEVALKNAAAACRRASTVGAPAC